jgi:hypothetical protein
VWIACPRWASAFGPLDDCGADPVLTGVARVAHDGPTIPAPAEEVDTVRRAGVILLLMAGAVSISLPTSATASPPTRGCPTSEWVLRASPSGGSGVPSVDQNHDGLSCFLEAPRGSGLYTVIDNAAR